MNANDLSEKSIVQAVLTGDTATFGTLVRRYFRSVYAVAFAQCNNHADAEDISQEAFLTAYRSLDTLREPNRFEGWVTTIARNLARNWGRRAQRNRETEMAHADSDWLDTNNASESTKNEIHRILHENIEILDVNSREVLHLHYFAGKSTQEIADLLETSQPAVLKRLQRGRERLGERLLTRYQDTFATDDEESARTDRIVKSIAGVAPAWTITTGANTIGSTGLPGLAKIVIATAAACGFFVIGSIIVMEKESPMVAQTQETPTAEPKETETEPDIASAENAEPATAAAESDELEVLGVGAGTVVADVTHSDLVPPITLLFEDRHIAEILQFIGDSHAIPFQLDIRAVGVPSESNATSPPSTPLSGNGITPAPYVTDGMLAVVDFKDVTILEAVQGMANALGLAVVSEPAYAWISTQANIDRKVSWEPESRFSEYKNEERLLERVTFDFKNIHLSDVMDYLSDNVDASINWDYTVIQPADYDAFKNRTAPWKSPPRAMLPPGVTTDGMVMSINAKEFQIRDALKLMLRPLGLTYVVDENILWISSIDRIRTDVPDAMQPQPDNRILKTLEGPVGMVFENIHVTDMLDFISDNYEVNAVLDQRTLTPKKYTTDKYGQYYGSPKALCDTCEPQTDGMIRLINVKKVAIREALDVLCRQLNLAYRIINGRIVVSRQELFADEIPEEFLLSPGEFSTIVKPVREKVEAANEVQGASKKIVDEPVLRLVKIRNGSKTNKVQISTGRGRPRWYGVDDAFEEFRVLSIDTDSNCCTIINEIESKTITLCVE